MDYCFSNLFPINRRKCTSVRIWFFFSILSLRDLTALEHIVLPYILGLSSHYASSEGQKWFHKEFHNGWVQCPSQSLFEAILFVVWDNLILRGKLHRYSLLVLTPWIKNTYVWLDYYIIFKIIVLYWVLWVVNLYFQCKIVAHVLLFMVCRLWLTQQ